MLVRTVDNKIIYINKSCYSDDVFYYQTILRLKNIKLPKVKRDELGYIVNLIDKSLYQHTICEKPGKKPPLNVVEYSP
jgi:hypothetical protein